MILTELMPTSLCKELDKSPMTHPQLITIARDVASALNCLHLWKPYPILHRDVSSGNVLLEQLGALHYGKVNCVISDLLIFFILKELHDHLGSAKCSYMYLIDFECQFIPHCVFQGVFEIAVNSLSANR